MKRVLSILLCLCMLFTFVPTFSAFADEGGSGSTSSGSDSGGGSSGSESSGSDSSGADSSGSDSSGSDSSGSDSSGSESSGSDSSGSDSSGNDSSNSNESSNDYSEENVEEYYTEQSTIYDLENEVDVAVEPEEAPPIEELDEGDAEDDIYGDEVFDAENAAQLSSADYVLDEIIIKFKSPGQVPGKEKQLKHEIEKVEKVGFVEALDVYVVKVDELGKNPNAVLNRFKNNKYIEYVEPNYTMALEYTPNDAGYRVYQTDIANAINAPAGWDIIKGSSSPIVAVVDSGVVVHQDLPPLLNGYSATSGLSYNNDKASHGTSVAGVIGAIGDNGIGAAGLNWNASILAVKVDDAAGTIPIANVAKGIIWAADNGAKIINLSLGTTADSATLKSAVDYAYNKGCAIFAATGNAGKNAVDYPARYSNVMGVGATGNGITRATISNYGTGLNVVAINGYYTTIASGAYSSPAGTSFASPQVAGLASLVWAVNPALTNDQVYRLIEQGCKPMGGGVNEQTGYGIIDVAKTLQLAGGNTSSAAEAQAKAEAEAKAAAEAKAKAEAEAKAAADAQAQAKAEAEAKAAAEAQAKAEAEAKAAAESTLPSESAQDYRTPPVITLTGFTAITLEYGQSYTESGYKAVDCKGLDLTGAVKVTNGINNKVAGLYTVSYEVTDSSGLKATATRSVTVNPQPVIPPQPQAPKITINGSNPIILHQTSSTPYKEQSAKAVDYDGTDISGKVSISGNVNRNVAGNYKLTYSITGKDGVTATATRDVRILAPNEKKDPRAKYGLSGQAKQGAKVTHTGIVSGEVGYMDLTVSSIDKNMTIGVQLVDSTTKKAVLSDSFSATGTKQYRINQSKYELVVNIDKANGNSKYEINLLMPETTSFTFADAEVPLTFVTAPQIAPIGSNPIILHLNSGTPYFEQGARAVDFDGKDISGKVKIIGQPDRDTAGTYYVTYRVESDTGLFSEVTREVRILAPDEINIGDEEVALAGVPLPNQQTPLANVGAYTYTVAQGDNLSGIAWQYGVFWQDIYEINKDIIGANPSLIYAGQVLTIVVQ